MLFSRFNTHKSVLQHIPTTVEPKTPRERILLSTLDEKTRSESCKDLKLLKQKTKIKMLTERLSSKESEEEHNLSKLKNSVYNDLKAVNTQMSSYQAIQMTLQSENKHLKELLDKKDRLITQFEEVARETTEKFNEMEAARSQQKTEEEWRVNTNQEALMKEISDLNKINESSFQQIAHLTERVNDLTQEKEYVIKRMNEQQLMSLEDKDEQSKRMTVLENDNHNLRQRNEVLMRELAEIQKYVDKLQQEKEMKDNDVKYLTHCLNEKEKESMETITDLRGMLDQLTHEKLLIKNKFNGNPKQSQYSNGCNNMTYLMKNKYSMN